MASLVKSAACISRPKSHVLMNSIPFQTHDQTEPPAAGLDLTVTPPAVSDSSDFRTGLGACSRRFSGTGDPAVWLQRTSPSSTHAVSVSTPRTTNFHTGRKHILSSKNVGSAQGSIYG